MINEFGKNVVRTDSAPGKSGGPPTMILPIEEFFDVCWASDFGRRFLNEAIEARFAAGGTIESCDGQVVYRLAADGETVRLLNQGVRVGAQAPRRRQKGAETEYVFAIPGAGAERDAAFSGLTKQQLALIDTVARALDQSKIDRLFDSALESILEKGRARVGGKEGRDLVGLFRYHSKNVFAERKLVTRIEPEEKDDVDTDDDGA